MRHRAYEGGDGGEGRCFALPPARKLAGANPHQERILASIAGVGYVRHGQIEEIDGFDFHDSLKGRVQ